MSSRFTRPMTMAAWLLGATVFTGCGPDASGSRSTQPIVATHGPAVRQRLSHVDADAALASVFDANQEGIASAPALVPPGAPLAPFIEARLYGIANLAVHDALNAIIPRFSRYADTGPIVPTANAAAAVLTAAHDAIVAAAPAAQAAV